MNQIVLSAIQLNVATVKIRMFYYWPNTGSILSSYGNLFYKCWPPLIEISAPVT
jgi:hypothetical protein